MRGKRLLVLVAVTALVVFAAMTTLRNDPGGTPGSLESGQLLLDKLLAKVNDVVRVDITSNGETFKVERTDSPIWSVPERYGYPAVADKVQKLLVGMGGLERLQVKTGKAERFAELGLGDPAMKDSRAIGYSLVDSAGAVVATLIVGNSRPARGDATRNEYFVRVPGEENSWLAIGTLPSDSGEVVDWLDTRIASVSDSRIARSRITHADGEVVTVERKSPDADSYAFVELPQGETQGEIWRVNDIARLLADLTLEDVKPAGEVPTDATQIEFTTETFDGLRVRMHVYDTAAEPLVTLHAEFDETLITPPGDRSRYEPPTPDKVREEVAMLNERWSKWAYVISKFKGDTVRRRPADLIRAPEKPSKPAG